MANQRNDPRQPNRSDSEPTVDRERVERVGRDEPDTASERDRRRDQGSNPEEETDLIESDDDQLMDDRVIDDEIDERGRSDR